MAKRSSDVNIRPGVSILALFRHLNYKPWYAIAEFVDNALQSYINEEKRLRKVEGPAFRLTVSIDVELAGAGRIVIRDNASGIAQKDFPRAFKPAQPPPDQSGLSEFGVGMKSAACWFAKSWSVRTKALGEEVERVVKFDVDHIVKTGKEVLIPTEHAAAKDAHYTEVTLTGLHHSLQTRTISKIEDHLASIYRMFLRDGHLQLYYRGKKLEYELPKRLLAPPHDKPNAKPVDWRKDIDIELSKRIRVSGFAALRETGSTTYAGFALFRRGRLIQGSWDEPYKPELIFGKSNSFASQRLFGELTVAGVDVSHTKDGFRWEEHEEDFLAALKKQLNSAPLRLLDQAKNHRVTPKREDVEKEARAAIESTAGTLADHQDELDEQFRDRDIDEPPAKLSPAKAAGSQTVQLDFHGQRWKIDLELCADPAVGDWVSLADHVSTTRTKAGGPMNREIGIRVNLAHPFMIQWGGTMSQEEIEPLLRVAVAIAIAEISARESGFKAAAMIRHTVNEIMRDALSKPHMGH